MLTASYFTGQLIPVTVWECVSLGCWPWHGSGVGGVWKRKTPATWPGFTGDSMRLQRTETQLLIVRR